VSKPPPEQGKKQAGIREKRGKIAWEGDLEAMRTEESTEFESGAESVSALTARFSKSAKVAPTTKPSTGS